MDFSRWTVKALSAELDSRGLPKGGKKEELVMRLEKDEKKKSRKRKEPERASAEEEVLASLECPVCFSRMMPPFSQCANGHVLCNECKPNIVKQDNKCPTCRVSLHNSFSQPHHGEARGRADGAVCKRLRRGAPAVQLEP